MITDIRYIIGESVTRETQIELFLKRFRRCWQPKCYVVPRNINKQALIELGLTPKQRKEIVLELTCRDYVEGPLRDDSRPKDEVFVFGKEERGKEVYIKLKVSHIEGKDRGTCLSFHEAEYPLRHQL